MMRFEDSTSRTTKNNNENTPLNKVQLQLQYTSYLQIYLHYKQVTSRTIHNNSIIRPKYYHNNINDNDKNDDEHQTQ